MYQRWRYTFDKSRVRDDPKSWRLATIAIVDYDSAWATHFDELRATIWPAVSRVALGIEHVGSTSVPGLAAKPVIDIDIVIASADHLRAAIDVLAAIGYTHRGDLGVPGRDAFDAPAGAREHNLYVCVDGCASLRNHLAVRDYLRRCPEAVAEYSDLKRGLAARHPRDIDAYIAGKTDFLCRILDKAGVPACQIDAIRRLNNPSAVDPDV